MIPEHLQERVTNSALLNYAHELEESVEYWKEKTEQAWQSARNAQDNAEATRRIGALIPLAGGGTMERHPADAILYQVEVMLTRPIPAPATQPGFPSA